MVQTDRSVQTTINTLARGFIDDPMLAYLFPNLDTRLDALTEWFQVFVADGFQRGTVTLTAASEGAIIWYPAEVNIFNAGFDAVLGAAAVIVSRFAGADGVARFERLGQVVIGNAPKASHLEVFWLAVQPEARGLGLGGQLLQTALQQADSAQVSTYLVSSNLRNVSFYERHGFRQTQALTIDGVLTLTQLWRNPHPLPSIDQ